MLGLAACEPAVHDMRGSLPDGGQRCEDGEQVCQGIDTLAVCVGGAGWNRDEGESWIDGRLALRFYY